MKGVPMQNLPLKIMIIGAGTGGLALAHGLKQAGIEVKVFERDRTPRDAQGGYRVGISPAGSQALKRCLPPDLFQLFLATSSRPPRYFNMLTEQYSNLISIEMDDGDPDLGEQNVNRLTLRRVLLTGLEDVVCFDKKFVRYEEADGGVTAFFEDGTHYQGVVLIGADGAGSKVRKQRLPESRQEETGILSVGGTLPLTAESKALLSEEMFYGMSMIMAPRGIGAIIHSLEFEWNHAVWKEPVKGDRMAMIARWPGFENEDTGDYIGWGLWASRKQFPTDPMKLSGKEMIALAETMTEGWHPHFRKLLQLTAPATMHALNIRTSIPVEPWETSNVTLLGDAIHTMTPGKGAGANTALRDAVLLLNKLTEVNRGEKSTLQAFHEYESEMLRYSSKAVIESRKQMNADEAIHKPVIGALQLGVMRAAMRVIDAVPILKRRATEMVKRGRAAEGQVA
jgi:2-polyprenyl-6-methoxyphenol hydroxylase-like FAD-dependent oxidoreductase